MRRRAMAQEMGRQKCKTSFRISIIHYGNPINEHMGVLSTFKNLSVTKSLSYQHTNLNINDTNHLDEIVL